MLFTSLLLATAAIGAASVERLSLVDNCAVVGVTVSMRFVISGELEASYTGLLNLAQRQYE
jgi:hypothetical protein